MTQLRSLSREVIPSTLSPEKRMGWGGGWVGGSTHHHLVNLFTGLLLHLHINFLLFAVTQVTDGEGGSANLIIHAEHVVVKHVQGEVLVLRLVNQQLKLLVPYRFGGVLLHLSLQLALVPHIQPVQHSYCLILPPAEAMPGAVEGDRQTTIQTAELGWLQGTQAGTLEEAFRTQAKQALQHLVSVH